VPTLWQRCERVEEVWFAGAHADVGGGYPERHLSDIALLWMAERLQEAGLTMQSGLKDLLKPDPYGNCHEPWKDVPWKHLPFGPRPVPPDAVLHESVRARRTRGGLSA